MTVIGELPDDTGHIPPDMNENSMLVGASQSYYDPPQTQAQTAPPAQSQVPPTTTAQSQSQPVQPAPAEDEVNSAHSLVPRQTPPPPPEFEESPVSQPSHVVNQIEGPPIEPPAAMQPQDEAIIDNHTPNIEGRQTPPPPPEVEERPVSQPSHIAATTQPQDEIIIINPASRVEDMQTPSPPVEFDESPVTQPSHIVSQPQERVIPPAAAQPQNGSVIGQEPDKPPVPAQPQGEIVINNLEPVPRVEEPDDVKPQAVVVAPHAPEQSFQRSANTTEANSIVITGQAKPVAPTVNAPGTLKTFEPYKTAAPIKYEQRQANEQKSGGDCGACLCGACQWFGMAIVAILCCPCLYLCGRRQPPPPTTRTIYTTTVSTNGYTQSYSTTTYY